MPCRARVQERRVIVQAEYTTKGANSRPMITHLEDDPKPCDHQRYCARGEIDNRIKEPLLKWRANRSIGHQGYPDQIWMLLCTLSGYLINTARELALLSSPLIRCTWARPDDGGSRLVPW